MTVESNFTDAAVFAEVKEPSLDIVSINVSPLFTKEECKKVLSECVDELWIPSTVIGDANFHKSQRQKLRGEVQGFPFTNIREITKSANESIYDFSLIGIIDQDYPQVFKYSENDFYRMHLEITPMAPSRKITFIVNLSDPAEYEGGQINFLNIDADSKLISEQGSCLIFPSYIPYSIDPVTKGSKNIIVGHIHGALFK